MLLAALALHAEQIWAQGQVDTSGSRVFYRNEATGGIILSSNGFGFGYRYAKRQNYLKLCHIEQTFQLVVYCLNMWSN